MATINIINNKSGSLTVDPGVSGDSFLQLDINSTGEWRLGCDDDAADAFKISQGSALGTNDTFVMTAAGQRTMPLQPCFLGDQSSTDLNVTGDGTVFQMGSGNPLTKIYDQGNDFTTGGVFTAPVDGKYFFTVGVYIEGIDIGITEYSIDLVTSNGTYSICRFNAAGLRVPAWQNRSNGNIHCDMDASDTATVNVTGSNGLKTITIKIENRDSSIAGFLIC